MDKTENLAATITILVRRAVAHVVAMALIGFAISVGIVILENGMTSISTTFELGPMFLLSLLILSVVSLPVGLFLRFLCDKVPARPFVCILLMCIILGLGLIPVAHPEITDERVAMASHRGELFLVHGIAGLLGGALWWLVEFRIFRKRIT